MTITQKQKESMYRYRDKNIKRIPLDVQKEKYDEIKAAATAAGESVNGYNQEAIERIEWTWKLKMNEWGCSSREMEITSIQLPLLFFVGNCDGIAGIETLLDGEQVGHRSIFAPLPLGNELLLSFG